MSIRKKFTILMLTLGLLPTLAVSAIGFITTSNELRSKTTDQLVSTASKQEQKITGLLQQRQESVTTLTNRFDLQSALGGYLTAKQPSALTMLDTVLQDYKAQNSDIQAITIADLHGEVVSTTLESNQGKTLPATDYAIPAGKETAVSVREDQRDNVDKLYITAKISVNKQESGIVNVVFRIDDIVAAVQDYTGLGTTGETVVASGGSSGHAISLFPLRFDTDAALNKNVDSLQLFDTQTRSRTSLDYRGHAVMVAPRTIGFADWVLATKIDTDEAFAPIAQMANTLATTLIVSSAVILLLSLWLTGLFTKPILQLAEVTQRIGKGDLGVRVALRRNDEIGLLGDNINAMGTSLKEFVSHIESERTRLEIILNSTAESILAIDKHGTILIANNAAVELTQMPKQAIVGKPIHGVFVLTQGVQPFAIDYAAGDATYDDLRYTDKAGGAHFVKIVVATVSGEQEQRSAQTIITIHDQTKTRELENMKIDFVSMAAHELRTPLASLRGYIELIKYKETEHLSPEANSYVRQALKSSNELGGLINNLLDVTRIERGTLTLAMERVDLAACVAQAVQDLTLAASEKHITLSYDGPNDGAEVIGDHIALREVINNLLTNAIRYTHRAGHIGVTLKREDDAYVTQVHDTGIGIPKAALPYLFTKFYRVHGGLDSGSTGTGLGLFISKSIIERHNGTIGVDSVEGTGSTFMFTVPVLDEERFAQLHTGQQSEQTFIRRHRGWITKNITH